MRSDFLTALVFNITVRSDFLTALVFSITVQSDFAQSHTISIIASVNAELSGQYKPNHFTNTMYNDASMMVGTAVIQIAISLQRIAQYVQ